MSEAEREFARLFQAEYPTVVRSVFLMLRDRGRAEDIAQEAFATLFSHLRRVSRHDRPDAWVRRVAMRMAIKAATREGRRAGPEREAGLAPTVAEGLPDVDLARAVAALPPLQRASVVLCDFEGRPTAEVADVLGISESTARVHVTRARRHLAETLHEEEGDRVERRLRDGLRRNAGVFDPETEHLLDAVMARGRRSRRLRRAGGLVAVLTLLVIAALVAPRMLTRGTDHEAAGSPPPASLQGTWTTGVISREALLTDVVASAGSAACAEPVIGDAAAIEWILVIDGDRFTVLARRDGAPPGALRSGFIDNPLPSDDTIRLAEPGSAATSFFIYDLAGDELRLTLTEVAGGDDARSCEVRAEAIVQLTHSFTRQVG